jgi:hypothetical protein
MGDDRTGPSDRHDRGWPNSAPALPETVAAVNAGQSWLHRACTVWEQTGRIIPGLWAESGERALMTQPMTSEAAKASPMMQAVLLGAMGQVVKATAVGTIHEVWRKQIPIEQDVTNFRPGDLGRLAEIDPEIQTCLIVVWGDLRTGYVGSELAALSIGDRGEVSWDLDSSAQSSGPLTEIVDGVLSGVTTLTIGDSQRAMELISDSMEWGWYAWDL